MTPKAGTQGGAGRPREEYTHMFGFIASPLERVLTLVAVEVAKIIAKKIEEAFR